MRIKTIFKRILTYKKNKKKKMHSHIGALLRILVNYGKYFLGFLARCDRSMVLSVDWGGLPYTTDAPSSVVKLY